MSKKRTTTISQQLHRAIRDSGLTSYRLGMDSGTKPTVIDRFMRGERDLRLRTVDKLAAVLELELRSKPKK